MMSRKDEVSKWCKRMHCLVSVLQIFKGIQNAANKDQEILNEKVVLGFGLGWSHV